MKQQWRALGEKFDLLSQRERGMIALAVVVVLGMLCYMPLESMWLKYRAESQQLASIVKENAISVQQVDLYQQRLALDPNRDYQNRLALVAEQTQAIDDSLAAQMVDMVPADYMPEVLSKVLANAKGIRLESFTSVAPKSLLQMGEENKVNLYSHGIKLTLEGDYFAILRFAQAVEAMPDKFYWKRLDYQVAQYPKAKVDLELYTLSISKDFISVAKQG